MNKKVFLKLFLIAGVTLPLIACGKPKETAPTGLPDLDDYDPDVITKIDEINEEPVEPEIEQIEDVNDEEPEAENEEEPEVEDEVSPAFEVEGSGYEEIVNLYADFLSDPTKYSALDYSDILDQISYGVQEAAYSDNRFDVVGFTLDDISGDGNPELIIAMDDDFSDVGDEPCSRILAIYGLTSDGPVRLIQGWARSRAYITGENKIYTEGSDGAASSGFYLKKLNPEGTEVINEKIIWAESTENSVNIYDKTDGKELIGNSWDDYFYEENECKKDLRYFTLMRFDN